MHVWQAGVGPAISLRLGQVLEAGSPGRAADLLVVLLAPGRGARLAMLDVNSEDTRLQVALDVVEVRSFVLLTTTAALKNELFHLGRLRMQTSSR